MEEEQAVLDFPTPSLTVYDHLGKTTEVLRFDGFDRNQLFLDELRHFLACVETRQRPITSLDTGMWSLRMALAARESIRTGRVIELAREER